ncbi:MAG: hypothetical protein RSC57_03440, partial [Bacilli bacterium]
PSYFSGSNAFVFNVGGADDPGYLSDDNVSNGRGLRVAISLTSDTLTVSGNGTQLSPYVI